MGKLTPTTPQKHEMTRKVLAAVVAHVERENLSPTIREIADAIGSYPSAVHNFLTCLHFLGYITRQHGKARSIQVTEEGHAWLAQFEEKE